MILVLTPCLYCNVSDSWMLPSKWQRAAIGAAGIYVELVMASICTFLWWFSYPELLLNKLALNVMFICSVSTVIFNANPLLRYDGYYILADLMEIPNLRQKATTILGRKLSEWCLGMEPPEDPFLPQRNQVFFALYSIAATIYRWIVALSICWFLYRFFLSNHLEIVGKAMVAASLWGLFIMPLYQAAKFFYVPGRIDQVKKPHFYTSLGALAALLLAFFFLPLPYSVICPLELQPRDRQPEAADADGAQPDELQDHRPARLRGCGGQARGDRREAGATGRRGPTVGPTPEPRPRPGGRQAGRRSAPARGAIEEPDAAELPRPPRRGPNLPSPRGDQDRHGPVGGKDRRPAAAAAGRSLGGDGLAPAPDFAARRSRREAAPLVGHAPGPGEPRRHAGARRPVLPGGRPDEARRRAGGRSGRPEPDPGRPGRSTSSWRATLPPSMTLHSKIKEIAESELKVTPRRLGTQHGGEVPSKTDPQTGIERPMSTSYQARVPIDDPAGQYRLGLRGQARVYTRWLPLGTRLWRLMSHTFNFKL